MINVRLKIGDDDIYDTFKQWGLIYIESDNYTEAPIKKRESTVYAEQSGENLDTRTVQDAFDYVVTFLIETPNKYLSSANAKIDAFNRCLWEPEMDEDGFQIGNIRKYKEVVFFNDYKRVKIVGYPEPISKPEKFYRSDHDCVIVDFKIRVSHPEKCEFNMNQGLGTLKIGESFKIF